MRALTADQLPPRQTYLQAIGLERVDPFATPVAELELGFTAFGRSAERLSTKHENRPPQFYDFFVPPPLRSQPPVKDVRQALREPRTAAIFGRPGDGKTTLRLVLESDCRRGAEHTLAVSYLLEEDILQPIDAAAHWQRLAEALAIDLVIQVVEHFNPLNPPPTREQVEALGGQIALGGRLLWRLVERILDEPEPSSLYGLSAHWSLVRRPIVKRVVASRELLHLLRTALRQVPTDLPRGEAAVLMGMKAARAWEFERCFVLLDGVDTHTRRRDTSFMFELLAPILNALSYWEQQQMWFKLFLPDELYQRVSETLQRLASNLTSSSITSIMEQWQPEDFHRLLVERFRVAGSRRVGFDDLTAPAMPDSLDRVLFRAAQGSPRRLLQIISGLIDAHAARDPHDRLFSPADWSAMQAQWNGEPPTPPALNSI